MSEISKLKARLEHAQNSLYKSLGADLAEASKRINIHDNSRIDNDTAIYNQIISQLVRLNINEFNNIVDSIAVKNATDQISKGAAILKKEAKLVHSIANNLSNWSKRIDKTIDIINKIVALV